MNNIYLQIIFLSIVVIFTIDLSGWTESWKRWLGRRLEITVGSVKPFDCSLCMTHHVCLLYAIFSGHFSLGIWAYICIVAFMTKPLGQLLQHLHEATLVWLYKLGNKLNL